MHSSWSRAPCIFALAFACAALSLLPQSSQAFAPQEDSELFVAMLQGSIELLTEPSKCAPIELHDPPTQENLKYSHRYGRIAETLAMIAMEFDAADAAQESRLSYTADHAIHAYELAFDCAPSYENRHHLFSAMHLINARVVRLQSKPEFAEVARTDIPGLKERRAALADKVPREYDKSINPCPVCEEAPAPPPPPPTLPSGYRGLYMDRISLRIEGGLGALITLRQGEEPLDPTSGGAFGLSIGSRFLLGQKSRFVLEPGARYTVTLFKGSEDSLPDLTGEQLSLHSTEMYLRQGVLILPRWFSAHAEIAMGLQAMRSKTTFGGVQLSPGGSLCTWGDSTCITLRGIIGSTNRKDSVDGMHVVLSFDVFRVVDQLIRSNTK